MILDHKSFCVCIFIYFLFLWKLLFLQFEIGFHLKVLYFSEREPSALYWERPGENEEVAIQKSPYRHKGDFCSPILSSHRGAAAAGAPISSPALFTSAGTHASSTYSKLLWYSELYLHKVGSVGSEVPDKLKSNGQIYENHV